MATFTSKWKLLWVHSVLNKIVIWYSKYKRIYNCY
jgi:hypothetical protein